MMMVEVLVRQAIAPVQIDDRAIVGQRFLGNEALPFVVFHEQTVVA